MLIVLFVFEILIIIMTIFTTHMVENKLKGLRNSLGIYCSKRAYKTKADIAFVEKVIKEFQSLREDSDEEPDIECIVKRNLQHEYIGEFSYVAVRNLAVKLPCLMWGVIFMEVAIAAIDGGLQKTMTIMVVTASLIVSIMMAFYIIIKGIDEKRETLIDETMDYVRNVYPVLSKEKSKAQQQGDMPDNVVKLSMDCKKAKMDQAYVLRNYKGKDNAKEIVTEEKTSGKGQENINDAGVNKDQALEADKVEVARSSIDKTCTEGMTEHIAEHIAENVADQIVEHTAEPIENKLEKVKGDVIEEIRKKDLEEKSGEIANLMRQQTNKKVKETGALSAKDIASILESL